MGNSGQGRRRSKRGLKPGQRHRGQFKPGTNAHNGAVAHRGPDLLPRRQVIAMALMAALFGEQLRDPRTGRLPKGYVL